MHLRGALLYFFLCILFVNSVLGFKTVCNMAGFLPKSADVIIVGCGASGLAAGRRLMEAGKKVVVLEALNRVGGRVHTHPSGIELGANWLHGIVGHPVYEYAVKKGIMEPVQLDAELGVMSLWNKFQPKTEGGAVMDPEVFGEANEAFQSFVEGTAADLPDESCVCSYDYLRPRFEKFVKHSSSNSEQLWRAWECLSRRQASYDGGELHDQHPLQFVDYQELEGPQTVSIPSGYTSVIEAMSAELAPDVIFKDRPVEKVKILDEGVEVHVKGGEMISAKHALITVSLGVLQAQSVSFEPALPKPKMEAIQRMKLGQVEKIFFEFTEAQWETLDSLGASYMMFMRDPNSEVTKGDGWTSKCSGVYRHPDTRYMVCWIVGDAATKQVNKATDQQLFEDLRSLLSTFLPEEQREHLPLPVGAIRTTWTQNPFTRGAWSYLARGSGPQDIKVLGEPVGIKNQVLFAGEATHPAYFGTVHGAFLTGLREADRILEAEK